MVSATEFASHCGIKKAYRKSIAMLSCEKVEKEFKNLELFA